MLTQRDKDIMRYLETNKAITINQANRIFFNECKFGYDRSRKRLKDLEDFGILKSYKEKVTNQKVYYAYDKVSAHDLYIGEFYSMLAVNGCTNIQVKWFPRYLKDLIRPDALFKFDYEDCTHYILFEVDFTHVTTLAKFQLYEKLYREEILQKEYGTFPLIVVVAMSDMQLKYESDTLDIVYLNSALKDFKSKIL